jgi:hypothetical protein
MSHEEEEQRIARHLNVIHAYLRKEFSGFDVPPGQSTPSLYHTFTVTNLTTYTSYTLRVGWPRLSDRDSTPGKTQRLLVRDNVAEAMRTTKAPYYYW